MCKLEITVKANFTSKINLGNAVRRIVLGEPAEFGKNRTLRFSGHP